MDVFLIENKELLKKYNYIWNGVNISIEKEFDSKPIYNKKFSKTKIEAYVMRLQVFMTNKFLK